MNRETGSYNPMMDTYTPIESESKPEKPTHGFMKYETKEGDTVDLEWNMVSPDKGEGPPSEAVIFLPGVAIEATSGPVIDLAHQYADASHLNSISISTRLDNPDTENSQSVQAEAIRQFIIDQGLTEVTLVGNSQGANKAGKLGVQLEAEGSPVHLRAVMMISPAGMYEQDSKELTKQFFYNAIITTPAEVIKGIRIKGMHPFKRPLKSLKRLRNELKPAVKSIQLGNSVTYGMAKEFVKGPRQFGKRANRESAEAAEFSKEDLKQLKAKVIVLLGALDSAFRSSELIPDDAHDASSASQQKRGEKMKREIFERDLDGNSEDVKVLEAKKDSGHGLNYINPKVAPATWHILERMERN